jgi:hypothetical protein
MTSFEDWLLANDIDCETLTPELARALVIQWQAEQQEPVRSLILIPDNIDQRWATAVRVEVAHV